MRIGFGLNLEQHQKLIMTPELRQAITILQLSTIELAEYIDQELLENPLLETKGEDFSEAETDTQKESKESQESNDSNDINDSNDSKETSEDERFDIDWQEYFNDRSDLGYLKPTSSEGDSYTFEHYTSRETTLGEHLLSQLNLASLSKIEVKIGEFLIGNIDEAGYLKCTLQEVAECLGQTEEEILKVLLTIQSFEPLGVGARNLKECLLIQIDFLNLRNSLLEKMVNNHLEDVAEGRLQKIASQLGVSVQEVQRTADALKTLDPRPGRAFFSIDDIKYIVPDVVVEKVGKEYIILVNDTTAPRLNINRGYRDVLLKGEPANEEAKKFIEDKLNSASWLIKSIEQRRLTIYKVANCLVELQQDFLENGVKYLKPLNLKRVADIVGVHESTISRATSNKYIQTPQGIFEMKYFFSSGLDQVGGEGVSSESIKRVVKDLISDEDAKRPLSDQKITDRLQKEGINISRRTVAKYRDELGIPSTSKRKRY